MALALHTNKQVLIPSATSVKEEAVSTSEEIADANRPGWQGAFQKRLVLILVLFLCLVGPRTGEAQEPTTRDEFWPEIDVYIHIKPKVRLYLLGAVSKSVEDGELFNAESFEGQVGVHVDYLPNPHVILRTGYRYGRALGENDDGFREHRFLTEQTLKKLLPGDLLLSDSNREDFRFLNGDFSFRYRNRVQIEREFHVFKGRTMTPYVSGAISYDTRYDIWNRNRLAVGLMTSLRRGPLRKMLWPQHQVILDLYYMHQNDSRSTPAHVNGLGAALSFYF
jgi:hypothetical protein